MAATTLALHRFGDALAAAVTAGAPGPAIREAAGRIFPALDGVEAAVSEALRPPVCRHLDEGIATARTVLPDVAATFAALAPLLAWRTVPNATGAFAAGHANAQVIGPVGLGHSERVRIGASLVAPGITYPDHRHPPEEVYLVLSPGEWRQNASPWHAPGIGGLVYNPPDIVHAMRAAPEAPLLAIWCLWIGP